MITSSMNVLGTVLQPTDNGKIAQESYFCYKITNKLRFLIHLFTCFYYLPQHWEREHKMYRKFVVITNRSMARCAHVMLWPVNYKKGIVFSGMVRLAGALVNPSGEFLLLVIMSRLNSSTVPSLWHPLCMCGPLCDRGDAAVRSSLAGNLWGGLSERTEPPGCHSNYYKNMLLNRPKYGVACYLLR